MIRWAALVLVFLQSAFTMGGTWLSVEADWLGQAEAWIEPPKPAQTFEDARGAVDGIRDGRYGFHVGHQANPWWQVELGTEPKRISRIVVYNRLWPSRWRFVSMMSVRNTFG
jgi:hypothetical protein